MIERGVKMINKNRCMSEFLAFRFIKDKNLNFYDGLKHDVYKGHLDDEITPVKTIDDIEKVIQKKIQEFYIPNKTAILLSGGMDSAILASYVPKGTKALRLNVLQMVLLMKQLKQKNIVISMDLTKKLLK